MRKNSMNNTDKSGNNINFVSNTFTEYGDFIRAIIRYHVNNEAQADNIFRDFFL